MRTKQKQTAVGVAKVVEALMELKSCNSRRLSKNKGTNRAAKRFDSIATVVLAGGRTANK
jgi:hypothetical protein